MKVKQANRFMRLFAKLSKYKLHFITNFSSYERKKEKVFLHLLREAISLQQRLRSKVQKVFPNRAAGRRSFVVSDMDATK